MWEALLSGGLSALGGLGSTWLSGQNTSAANQQTTQNAWMKALWDRQQAQEQMAFQERMSNTAYQRSTADMRAAGLNPALMFGSGAAATTPGGARSEMSTPSIRVPQAPDILSPAVSSALQTFNVVEGVNKVRAETEDTLARIDRTKAETARVRAETSKTLEEVPNTVATRALIHEQEQAARSSAIRQDAERALTHQKWRNIEDYGVESPGLGQSTLGRVLNDLVKAHGASERLRNMVNPRGGIVSSPSPTARGLATTPEHPGWATGLVPMQ